ncbi:hypothetical protein IJI76_02415 [Candidatus Saccharibacteria bacterium]|nr:hypothetical protein [Candidatus Saccharibacteria bacterium]
MNKTAGGFWWEYIAGAENSAGYLNTGTDVDLGSAFFYAVMNYGNRGFGFRIRCIKKFTAER